MSTFMKKKVNTLNESDVVESNRSSNASRTLHYMNTEYLSDHSFSDEDLEEQKQ